MYLYAYIAVWPQYTKSQTDRQTDNGPIAKMIRYVYVKVQRCLQSCQVCWVEEN